MSHARKLDQFYTSRPIALRCLDFLERTIHISETDTFLEPSAGDGAFLELLLARAPGRCVGIDIDPMHPEVLHGSFLDYEAPTVPGRRITVGNPPFGKNSSLAVAFFKHAARFSNIVAFVVPLTFRKASMQKRLPSDFELVDELTLPPESFVFEGSPYSVPCSFQIWRQTDAKRVHVDTPLQHPDFEFCEPAEAEFAIRRIGALAGKVLRDFEGYSPNSHYYIRPCAGIENLARLFEAIDWDRVKHNTAGVPSISKRELVVAYAAARDSDDGREDASPVGFARAGQAAACMPGNADCSPLEAASLPFSASKTARLPASEHAVTLALENVSQRPVQLRGPHDGSNGDVEALLSAEVV